MREACRLRRAARRARQAWRARWRRGTKMQTRRRRPRRSHATSRRATAACGRAGRPPAGRRPHARHTPSSSSCLSTCMQPATRRGPASVSESLLGVQCPVCLFACSKPLGAAWLQSGSLCCVPPASLYPEPEGVPTHTRQTPPACARAVTCTEFGPAQRVFGCRAVSSPLFLCNVYDIGCIA